MFLGDSIYGQGRTVDPESCDVYRRRWPGYGTDWAVCKLSETVTDVTITPPLMGCETEALVEGDRCGSSASATPTTATSA